MIVFAKFIDLNRGSFTMSADGNEFVVTHHQNGNSDVLYTGGANDALAFLFDQARATSTHTPVYHEEEQYSAD